MMIYVDIKGEIRGIKIFRLERIPSVDGASGGISLIN
jgi:hypothetical protein